VGFATSRVASDGALSLLLIDLNDFVKDFAVGLSESIEDTPNR